MTISFIAIISGTIYHPTKEVIMTGLIIVTYSSLVPPTGMLQERTTSRSWQYGWMNASGSLF